MYIDYGVNWKKIAQEKNIYIFGGGKRGRELYERLVANSIKNIIAIIDNNAEVVNDFNNGNKWISRAYLPSDFKKINNNEKDLVVISTDIVRIKNQLLELGIYNSITESQIDLSIVGEKRYDDEYFNEQIKFAEVDSKIDKAFFSKYIKRSDTVVEFGCGGGLLLNELDCINKIGIEINKSAREYAKSLGICTYETIDEIEDNFADIVISTHALEHCLSPFEILQNLQKKIKPHGKIVFVVPYEPLSYGFLLNDFSQHLYTWTERTLGNLIRAAGFYIRETGTKEVAWPDNWYEVFSKVDRDVFNALSKQESFRSGYYSVFVVGEKM